MARKRASMREGPLAELFKATEAAQRQAEREGTSAEPAPTPPEEQTVEHVPDFASEPEVQAPPPPAPPAAAAPPPPVHAPPPPPPIYPDEPVRAPSAGWLEQMA